MTPALAVAAEVAGRGLQLEVSLPAGQVHAVLGANGAGKSTLLGLAAGTVRPTAGTVAVAGTLVAGPGVWVAPHRRGVGLLAQQPLLFPHLTAAANVAFGLQARGRTKGQALRQAADLLGQLGLAAVATRHPHELSGGQQARIAVARALAPQPHLLLLDEPLAALDVTAATEVRAQLRSSLREAGRSSVLVTHDLLDVLALADTVTVLGGGQVVEHGPTAAVLAAPRTPFLAELIGVNLVLGTRHGEEIHATGLRLRGIPAADSGTGQPAAAMFDPRAVAVYRDPPAGSPRNVVAVTVSGIEHRGALLAISGQVPGGPRLRADVTPAAVAAMGITAGDRVYFVVKAAEVAIYPA